MYTQKIQILISTLILLLLVGSCDDSTTTTGTGGDDSSNDDNTDWIISPDKFRQGSSKDGIPSIENPGFIKTSSVTFMQDKDFVAAVMIDGTVKAYPYRIMDWHEVVNDKIKNSYYAFTFCPLTGSALAWDRTFEGEPVEFGVSGLLLNNNLVAYDRKTDSYWSQMLAKSVAKERAGEEAEQIDVFETQWKTFKKLYPDADFLARSKTGFNFPYADQRVYGNYRYNDDQILYPLEDLDSASHGPSAPSRLPNKTLVHGIIGDNEHQAYPINNFPASMTVYHDQLQNTEYVIIGSDSLTFAASFKRTLNGRKLTFEAVQDQYPAVMRDESGNQWDVFGRAVSGPDKGSRLETTQSYNAYWFAWNAFWPQTTIKLKDI